MWLTCNNLLTREKYQLIKSPVEHKDPDFFDPGAKYHVAADSQYISYFVSHILQFQFYRSLCIAAKQYDPVTKSPPLHKCDFYKSEEAGKLLTYVAFDNFLDTVS